MKPGQKLLMVFALVCAAAVDDVVGLSIAGLGSLVGLVICRCPCREALLYLRGFSGFVIIMALAPILFTPGVQVEAFQTIPLFITYEGLEKGIVCAVRLTVLFFLSMLFLRTTSPSSLVRCLEDLCARPHWIPAWIREVVAVGLLALQLLPVVCVRAETWVTAMLEREGDCLCKMGVFKRARHASGLLAPMLTALLRDPEKLMLETDLGRGKD